MKYGICHICLEQKKLTFEHFPPKSCFNNGRAVLNNKLLQRGVGDYVLCEECNNKTGKWYVPYCQTIYLQIGLDIYNKLKYVNRNNLYEYIIKNINLFYFAKELLVIMCDIMPINTLKELNIKDLILNKNKFLDEKDEKWELQISICTDYFNGLFMSGPSYLNLGNFSSVVFFASMFPLKIALTLNKGMIMPGYYSLNKYLKYGFVNHSLDIKCILDRRDIFDFIKENK